ncbi:hypothetical protein [Antrihabitans cavernicola]|uniref:DUF4175 domain-containing protein n=1 Tax=Antrihabitans cavernicola TaxID=2495913 RepID=A0A5A7S596_9NOCA|nr:hypothetical protein [Spelaeibacter cavernicola]KAA0018972.1 hypothetical protein FOY51_23330 [Spelaeibacter cavernicola]
MNHPRIFRAVLGVCAGYAIIFAIWAGWLVQHTPPGTLQYQIAGLLGLLGFGLGVAMMLANRPTKADRRLLTHGLEGWARIEDAHPVQQTDHHSELTELQLQLTVPGSESYSGRIVFDVTPIDRDRLAVGAVVPVRVDPHDRGRIMLCPDAGRL